MEAKKVNYQKLNAELDDIILQLQKSDLDIDEAIKLHRRGTQIAETLKKYIDSAKLKITKANIKQGK